MRFDDGAEGVLVGRADEVLADEATVLDAVFVRPVVVFDTDIEFARRVVKALPKSYLICGLKWKFFFSSVLLFFLSLTTQSI